MCTAVCSTTTPATVTCIWLVMSDGVGALIVTRGLIESVASAQTVNVAVLTPYPLLTTVMTLFCRSVTGRTKPVTFELMSVPPTTCVPLRVTVQLELRLVPSDRPLRKQRYRGRAAPVMREKLSVETTAGPSPRVYVFVNIANVGAGSATNATLST